MLSYNLSTVKSVKVLKKKKNKQFKFVPSHSKFFGLIKYPDLFFDMFTWKDEGQEKCPSNHYLENGQVFEEPHIILCFIDGDCEKFYFDTPEEAYEVANNIKKRSGCEWYEKW